ncbi:MAG TPA: S8 family serine peptidase [Pyrinomonadaceae bacterium]|nr:S8 family serine peptidase [Pyrinomonadaceae bacterium]
MANRKQKSSPADKDFAGRKLQPKLRMIVNGSTEVNVMRAEYASSVAVKQGAKCLKTIRPQRDTILGKEAATKKWPKRRANAKGRTPLPPSKEIEVNVFIETIDADDNTVSLTSRGNGGGKPLTASRQAAGKGKLKVEGETLRKTNIAAATVTLSELKRLAERPDVTYIELGEALVDPLPVKSMRRIHEPPQPRKIRHAHLHHHGRNVLIGIIDVQGFDFAHEDFLDSQGRTRFIRIWDQGGDPEDQPSPSSKRPFNYGSEFDQTELNRALSAAPRIGVPPHELARQSEMVEGAHGTHVASIAAGKYGVCPEAEIAAVLVSLPRKETQDQRASFYDSTRVVHAVEYLLALAKERRLPVSINISLGTNGHAHDATSTVSRWIDAAMALPGRCVTVAAGNAGQEKPAFEGDRSYFMGRIHTSGTVPARGLSTDIDWLVVGNTIADVSENELEIWYNPQDRFSVMLRPPGGNWIGPVKPHEFYENLQLDDGSFVSIYNELYHPANGANYIAIYLSPFLSRRGTRGIRAGQWTVRLYGEEVRDGRYHGWIERDDPRPVGRRIGDQEAWSFPSFFSARTNVDSYSVGSLACGQRVISVGNLDLNAERINITSSQGPTRDDRYKPDVAAPGTNITAAKGFAGDDERWIEMTGTSMASPYVAGVVGLMLSTQKNLTAAQIEGIIKRTARPLPGASYSWLNDAGFGRIDPDACILEAAKVNTRKELKK